MHFSVFLFGLKGRRFETEVSSLLHHCCVYESDLLDHLDPASLMGEKVKLKWMAREIIRLGEKEGIRSGSSRHLITEVV